MAVRLAYLTTLKIMAKGERIMLLNSKWLLPSFPYSTIVAQDMYEAGWFREDKKSYKPEISEIRYFQLSKTGLEQLEEGKKWYSSLNIIEKILLNFKLW